MNVKTIVLVGICVLVVNNLFAERHWLKMPEWYSLSYQLSEWCPVEGRLTVEVKIKSTIGEIRDINSTLVMPDDLKMADDTRNIAKISKADKVVLLYNLQIPSNYHGWLQYNLTAQPPVEQMKKEVRKSLADSPQRKKIMLKELDGINAPFFIGASIAVTTRDDLAMAVAPQLIMQDKFDYKDTRLYLWYPPENIVEGITQSTFNTYSDMLNNQNTKGANRASRLIVRRLDERQQPLQMKVGRSEIFSVPTDVVKELLRFNNMILDVAESGEVQKLHDFAKTMKPSIMCPFLYYNIALIHNQNNNHEQYRLWLRRAINELPSWPQALKLYNE